MSELSRARVSRGAFGGGENMAYLADRCLWLAWVVLVCALGGCGDDDVIELRDAGSDARDGGPRDSGGDAELDGETGLACPGDDSFEPNNEITEATVVASPEPRMAIACDGNPDVYAVSVGDGCSVGATLSFAHADGDLDVIIRDGAGNELGAGRSEDDNEVALAAGLTGGRYYVEVVAKAGASNLYSLSVQRSCLACPGDDSLENNDEVGDATPLTLSTPVAAIACAGDLDIYRVDVAPGCSLDVGLSFTNAAGNLDLQVESMAGALVGESTTTNDIERVMAADLPGGRYFVTVSPRVGVNNAYLLTATQACRVCPADDGFEPNNGLAAARTIDREVVAQLCDDDYYAILAPAGCTVIAGLSQDPAMGDATVALLSPSGEELATSMGAAAFESVDAVAAVSGPYAVRVRGPELAYVLSPMLVCPDFCPADDANEPNEDSLNATVVAAGDYGFGVLCTSTADVFAIDTPSADCRIRAEVVFDRSRADVGLSLLDVDFFSEIATGMNASVGPEVLNATVATADRRFLRITLNSGTETWYALRYSVMCPM